MFAWLALWFGINAPLVFLTIQLGGVFAESFCTMSSLRHHQSHYLFDFLALGVLNLAITGAEIFIMLTYLRLTSVNELVGAVLPRELLLDCLRHPSPLQRQLLKGPLEERPDSPIA